MIALQGRPICGGIVFGRIFMFEKNERKIPRYNVEDIDRELERFDNARRTAVDELERLYIHAIKNVGQSEAMIFSTHQIMLEDADYDDMVKKIIRNDRQNAERAVEITCENLSEVFDGMDNEYIRERGEDIKDISERIIKILSGSVRERVYTDEPVIVAAHALAPSDIIQFDKNKILAFAPEKGSYNSHSAILARTMHLPAITAVPCLMNEEYNGKEAAIDGYSGTIYIEPDKITVNKLSNAHT